MFEGSNLVQPPVKSNSTCRVLWGNLVCVLWFPFRDHTIFNVQIIQMSPLSFFSVTIWFYSWSPVIWTGMFEGLNLVHPPVTSFTPCRVLRWRSVVCTYFLLLCFPFNHSFSNMQITQRVHYPFPAIIWLSLSFINYLFNPLKKFLSLYLQGCIFVAITSASSLFCIFSTLVLNVCTTTFLLASSSPTILFLWQQRKRKERQELLSSRTNDCYAPVWRVKWVC